jgi:hypothetical protein
MFDEITESLEKPASVCLERTRSTVLNVLVVVGAGIAASGWLLGRMDRGAELWDPVVAWRIAAGVLIALFAASWWLIRVGSGRASLLDPAHRASRFARAHVAAAIVGGLAVPLGFAYGWAIQPRIEAVSPFWVVALASGFLALPRGHELAGFDSPIPDPDHQQTGEPA